MSCRTSIGRPLDSTGRPIEFCKFASNVLQLLISSRNTIKISTGRPVELLYRTSPRTEDLGEYPSQSANTHIYIVLPDVKCFVKTKVIFCHQFECKHFTCIANFHFVFALN